MSHRSVAALASAVAGTLAIHADDPLFFEQLAEIGFLIHFESLLSTFGKELGILEDMIAVVGMLSAVQIRLRPMDGSEAGARVRVLGQRDNLVLEAFISRPRFDTLPVALRSTAPVMWPESGAIAVKPAMLSLGINVVQSFANRIGDTSLQDHINDHGCAQLRDYATAYLGQLREWQKRPCMLDMAFFMQQQDRIKFLLLHLEAEASVRKSKNVALLTLSEELVWRLNGGRVTCCKSGKDRTSMAVTLEQCQVLCREHKYDTAALADLLDQMRSCGTRADNVEKNIGERKYAFNAVQMRGLPKLLRPPQKMAGATQM